jgi:hypothetical protein
MNHGGMEMKRLIICFVCLILTVSGSVNACQTSGEFQNATRGIDNWEPYNVPDELCRNFNGPSSDKDKNSWNNKDCGNFPDVTEGSFKFQSNNNKSGYNNSSWSSKCQKNQNDSNHKFADQDYNCHTSCSDENDNLDNREHMPTFSFNGDHDCGHDSYEWDDCDHNKSKTCKYFGYHPGWCKGKPPRWYKQVHPPCGS